MKQHALTHKNSSFPLSPSNSNSNSQFNNSSDSEEKDREEDRSDAERDENISRHEPGVEAIKPFFFVTDQKCLPCLIFVGEAND
jgi:hypothetical protein